MDLGWPGRLRCVPLVSKPLPMSAKLHFHKFILVQVYDTRSLQSRTIYFLKVGLHEICDGLVSIFSRTFIFEMVAAWTRTISGSCALARVALERLTICPQLVFPPSVIRVWFCLLGVSSTSTRISSFSGFLVLVCGFDPSDGLIPPI